MRLQKTLVETHEFPNGEIKAVLYDNDDKVVRVVEIDEEGMPILSESERNDLIKYGKQKEERTNA